MDKIAEADTARLEAADARVAAEAVLAEADKQAKAADQALSSAREERARTQALSESAAARIAELRSRIHDELECAPEDLAERRHVEQGTDAERIEERATDREDAVGSQLLVGLGRNQLTLRHEELVLRVEHVQ